MRRSLVHLVAVGAAALAAACSGADANPADPAATAVATPPDTALLGAEAVRIAGITLAPVERRAWAEEWTAPGRLTLDPSQTQALGSLVEGRVARVLVLPGDAVRAGQPLVALHAPQLLDARSQLSSAEASLLRAESELRLATSSAARTERLHAAKAASLAELERARAARTDAEAARSQAAAELERARGAFAQLGGGAGSEALVRSPIDGVVITREAEPGQVVSAGTPLVTVSRLSELALVAHVPEAASGAVRVGEGVRFSVLAHPGRTFEARITRVAPRLDPATRTLEVTAAVRDPDGALRPEMFAEVRLAAPAGAEVLAVPADAVQALEGDTVLIVAAQRGEGLHLEAVPVRIGRRSPSAAEIREGVAEGTRVVAGGAAIAKAEIMRLRGAGEE
jgi:cobalt-zinc-cadmium efflux system membrane fusion protein